MIDVVGQDRNTVLCRAIIDTGSSNNFIVEELAARLRLPKTLRQVCIGTLGDMSTVSEYGIIATIKSRCSGYQKSLEFLTVPSITSLIPDQQLDRKALNIPKDLQLADPEFHNPNPVQLLIGAGTALGTLSVGQIRLSEQKEPDLILQKTQLGWILGGSMPFQAMSSRNKSSCHILKLESDVSRFWEIEEVAPIKYLSKEEAACEDHFRTYCNRNPDGRYVAALPFNEKKVELGQSRHMALRRLQSLEKRFIRDPSFKQQYVNVIDEYLKLGYINKLQDPSNDGFFLAHQAVLKEASATTKIRVVFDASAESSTGVSLNQALMAGPALQDDIFTLLLRFRLYNHVLTGDIEKMYLQILIREEDQPYLRMLWRENDGSLSTYQFNRLIFGLKPASFIATRCLQQLADDEQLRYPLASVVLKRDVYVDDLLTGANTIEEVVKLREEISELLVSGGFNLRQCASNTAAILNAIPERNVNLQLRNAEDSTLKTLGVHWNSLQDAIIYTVRPPCSDNHTKRSIFSEIAKIFDPLGLLNPVTVYAKLLMQDLWRLKVDWDESLPNDIHTKWNAFVSQLPLLNDISYDRKMLYERASRVELHGFCDASEKAYGACIYLKSIDRHGRVRVQLYCAKSRVAPIKTIQTIPRLELCAAALLSALYNSVRTAIDLNVDQTVFWTDSMITLHWINSSPHSLKTFVANRVSDIQSKTSPDNWKYVPTFDNPADLLSRGQLPAEFKRGTLWNKGPVWLKDPESEWPTQKQTKPAEVPELRKIICLQAKIIDDTLLKRYSSYSRLVRITAFCLRFRFPGRSKGCLTVIELQTAAVRILQLLQQFEFPDELKQLRRREPLPAKSRLLSLNPFLDNDGLIRVGGRLQNSDRTYQEKHPIVLPKSHVTKLIITKEHVENLHTGVQATLYAVRQNYWPIDGRNQVRQVIRSCTCCARAKPLPVEYVMGNLPKVRVTEARPFSHTGVDYCGPFYIKERRYRNRNKIKVYVAIFICLSVKAVHLELVSDLTTEAFLAALRRFISRRGRCQSIHSDSGTNFVGANNELKDLQALISSSAHNEKVHNYLSTKGINWQFSPPHSPHFGGIWEAAVRSFKHHLKRVVGSELFTFEQMNTLIVEIEAVLNSRPLTPISSDPHDLTVLTPAHFLIGDALSSLPSQDLSTIASNRLSVWRHIQKVKQDFWTRWHKEYLNELTVRHKWARGSHGIKEGSIVLIREANLPPLEWRLGRVIQAYPGQDGVIRTVRVKTATGVINRTVKQLAPLPE